MSERATAYKIPTPTAHPSGGELAVRPKVLRRPAHFGARNPVIEAPAPILIPLQIDEAPTEKAAPAFRAWQDDGKFAITLLAFVIVINLVVSAWLSAISPAKPAPASASTATTHAPAANAAIHVLDSNARDISDQ